MKKLLLLSLIGTISLSAADDAATLKIAQKVLTHIQTHYTTEEALEEAKEIKSEFFRNEREIALRTYLNSEDVTIAEFKNENSSLLSTLELLLIYASSTATTKNIDAYFYIERIRLQQLGKQWMRHVDTRFPKL